MQTTQPLISVIIPIYNVEKYLKKCITSVINQDYKNLDIILVDDGSTDSSGYIAEQLALKDDRITVIHQTNQGLSSARNHGLEKMNGSYVTFIDSDDYVANDYVSYLYGLIHENNCQLAICSLIDTFEKTGVKKDCGNGQEMVISGKDCIRKMCYHDLVDTCAYAKLGAASLYKGFQFPVGKLFEDIGSTYQLFLKCDRVACGFKGKYYYVIRDNSITTALFSPSKLDLLEMTDKMARDVTAVYPDLYSATLRRQVYARFSTLNQTLGTKSGQYYQKQLISFIKSNKREILTDPNTPKRDKTAYYMLSLGLPFYKIAWQGYQKFVARKK